MSKPKYIKDWSELKNIESDTHIFKLSSKSECSGWIKPKKDNADSWEGVHYLSTHTFYGSQYKYSTKILQDCGFYVELANWDELRTKV